MLNHDHSGDTFDGGTTLRPYQLTVQELLEVQGAETHYDALGQNFATGEVEYSTQNVVGVDFQDGLYIANGHGDKEISFGSGAESMKFHDGGEHSRGEIAFENVTLYENANGELEVEDSGGNTTVIS